MLFPLPGGSLVRNNGGIDVRLHEDLLLALLDGCDTANAAMPWGKPGPVFLPVDEDARRSLIRAHLEGKPANVLYIPEGQAEQSVDVAPLVLSSFCPASDGKVRWIGFDLDASDGHGEGGLVDPARALGCLAERADAAGMFSGLVCSVSGGGKGRHVRLTTPGPVCLDDAVLVAAGLAAAACRIANQDVEDFERPHAFLCGNGVIASPGEAGRFELFPVSTLKPRLGWPLTLPLAGAHRARGGGLLVDPFTGKPIDLEAMPETSPEAWARFLRETRQAIARRQRPAARPRTSRKDPHQRTALELLEIAHPETRALVSGQVEQGNRNAATFKAACNLLGLGLDPSEVESLVLQGAMACGLRLSEARAAVQSALKRKGSTQ